jgi:hypothetical protein
MIFNIGSVELTYYFDEFFSFLVICMISGLLSTVFTSFNLCMTVMHRKKINKDNRYRVLEVAITIISSSIQYLLSFAFDYKYVVLLFCSFVICNLLYCICLFYFISFYLFNSILFYSILLILFY